MKFSKDEVRFTSDTHFWHANAVKFDKSPYWSDKAKHISGEIAIEKDKEKLLKLKQLERAELTLNCIERDADIVKNWNETVNPKQTVVHMGDWSFNSNRNANIELIKKLNGKIILIKGNHEKPAMQVSTHFESVHDYLEIFIGTTRICAFHYPIHEWNQAHRGAWMLHGHTHIKDDYDPKLKRCNVGIMNWNYKPISFEQLQIFMADKDNKNTIKS